MRSYLLDAVMKSPLDLDQESLLLYDIPFGHVISDERHGTAHMEQEYFGHDRSQYDAEVVHDVPNTLQALLNSRPDLDLSGKVYIYDAQESAGGYSDVFVGCLSDAGIAQTKVAAKKLRMVRIGNGKLEKVRFGSVRPEELPDDPI